MVEAALEKEGRVAVVVPHGVLFRGGAEGRIRQKMIEDNLLDAVIGLPGNLFPTTNIPVAILVFDRSREKGGAKANSKDVLFIDASREYQSGKNQNTLIEEHIRHITHVYQAREAVDKYAHVAGFDEIRDNDFNLNIPRYVDSFEEEEEIDIDAVQTEIDDLEKELATVRAKMAEKLKEIQR
jgi:type I restriction enzyme M protein